MMAARRLSRRIIEELVVQTLRNVLLTS